MSLDFSFVYEPLAGLRRTSPTHVAFSQMFVLDLVYLESVSRHDIYFPRNLALSREPPSFDVTVHLGILSLVAVTSDEEYVTL